MTPNASIGAGVLSHMARVRALPQAHHHVRSGLRQQELAPPHARITPRQPVVSTPAPSRARHRRAESLEYRLIFSAAFGVFLVTSALERVSPYRLLARKDEAAVGKSVFEQAREAANISVGYAFMG